MNFKLPEIFKLKNKIHIRETQEALHKINIMVLALLPCLLIGIYNIGFQNINAVSIRVSHVLTFLYGLKVFLPIIVATCIVGCFWEITFSIINKRSIDLTFIIPCLLFCFVLPPSISLWHVVFGISFGIVIGKEIFGGPGKNIFNTVLIGRAFLFVFSPKDMIGRSVWVYIDKNPDSWYNSFVNSIIDAFTTATPTTMDAIAKASPFGIISSLSERQIFFEELLLHGYQFKNLLVGIIPGSIGETSALVCLLGAIILVVTKNSSWRIMAGCVVGALLVSGILYFLPGNNPTFAIPPHYHLVLGGFAFGTVFLAADPITSPISNGGKWIYGLMTGALIIGIRSFNPLSPEGVTFAILIMNLFVPVINQLTIGKS